MRRTFAFTIAAAITVLVLAGCGGAVGISVTGVTLNKSSTTIPPGGTEQLTATVLPAVLAPRTRR